MNKIILAIILFIASDIASFAADNIFLVVVKKNQEKEKSRWSLMEWLKLKETISLQNQWLALNSSSNNFEGLAQFSSAQYKQTEDSSNFSPFATKDLSNSKSEGQSYALSLYYSILGIEANQFESSNHDFKQQLGMVNLRLLGNYDQGTNIKVQYGLRKLVLNQGEEEVTSPFWGAGATIYLAKFLGVDGIYRIFNEKSSKKDNLVDGFYREGGGFVEISLLRVFVKWFKQKDYIIEPTNQNSYLLNQQGIKMGAAIFF